MAEEVCSDQRSRHLCNDELPHVAYTSNDERDGPVAESQDRGAICGLENSLVQGEGC